jgi:hypothetical protein
MAPFVEETAFIAAVVGRVRREFHKLAWRTEFEICSARSTEEKWRMLFGLKRKRTISGRDWKFKFSTVVRDVLEIEASMCRTASGMSLTSGEMRMSKDQAKNPAAESPRMTILHNLNHLCGILVHLLSIHHPVDKTLAHQLI